MKNSLFPDQSRGFSFDVFGVAFNDNDLSLCGELLEDDSLKRKRDSFFSTDPNTPKALTDHEAIHPSAKPTPNDARTKRWSVSEFLQREKRSESELLDHTLKIPISAFCNKIIYTKI